MRASCPHLDATAAHVTAFAKMLTGRHGERLESWMAAVEAADLPHLQRFVTGLRRDHVDLASERLEQVMGPVSGWTGSRASQPRASWGGSSDVGDLGERREAAQQGAKPVLLDPGGVTVGDHVGSSVGSILW